MLNLERKSHYDKKTGWLKHMPKLQRRGQGAQRGEPRRISGVPKYATSIDYEPVETVGVRIWKNKNNGFSVLWLHYTADPAKRHPMFKKLGRPANPLWDQEMEIDPKSKRGIKFLGDYNWDVTDCDIGPEIGRQKHRYSSESLVIPPFEIPDWWPMWLTTDPGRSNCWSTQIIRIDENGVAFVTHELLEKGLDYTQAKPRIAHLVSLAGGGKVEPEEHVIDNDAEKKRVESVKTLIELMEESPFSMICSPVSKNGGDFVMLQIYRARIKRRPQGWYGMYWFSTCPGSIRQHATCVYAPTTGQGEGNEGLLRKDKDSVDGGKYFATYTAERAIRPKVPDKHLTGEQRLAKLLWLDRAKRAKIARDQSQAARQVSDWEGIV